MKTVSFENRFDPDNRNSSYPNTNTNTNINKSYPYPSNGQLGPNKKLLEPPAFDEDDDCCASPGWWTEPPKDFLPANYCQENSMHGLKYVAQNGRHLTERICWMVAFIIGLGAAVFLINGVWENYRKNPVIVSFQPSETDIKDIPFPAVTICNMNLFSKSLIEELRRDTSNPDWKKRQRARLDLQFLRSICETSQSFSKSFHFAAHRGQIKINVSEDVLNQTDSSFDLFSLILEKTIPCDEMIRLCSWADEKFPCGELFKPIITEYGKCCTFNILPLPLLITGFSKDRLNDESLGQVSIRTNKLLKPRWNKSEVSKWEKWDYTKDGFILEPSLSRPHRQSRAGIPFGLALLLDANTDEYFCPSTDSEGFRLVLHTALEVPPVMNQGVAIGLGKEIFMELSADMTLADPKVSEFPYEKRNCFFQSEKTLQFYNAYTTTNCLSECIANITTENCGCTLFYMPRNNATRICSTVEGSVDDKCATEVGSNLTRDYRTSCKLCDSLCTDIFYHFVLSQAQLQDSKILWGDPEDPTQVPAWASHKMSITHIYFALDSFVPKVRNELYATVDLIANTGGLLGLCLGFSALSAVEFVYFFTIRLFFQRLRRRTIGRRIAKKFVDAFRKFKLKENLDYTDTDFTTSGERIIEMDKTILPIYPVYTNPHVNTRDDLLPEKNSRHSRSRSQDEKKRAKHGNLLDAASVLGRGNRMKRNHNHDLQNENLLGRRTPPAATLSQPYSIYHNFTYQS